MKVLYSVIVLLAALGLAHCLPAIRNEEQTTQKELNKEVDFVPLGNRNIGAFSPSGVVDIDAGSFFDGDSLGRSPFSSSFQSLEAAFTRMRQLMNQLLGRIPTEQSGVPDFPELHIPNFGNVDLGKGNTTSVTKIINGHKVTINDTEYKSEEGNGASFFKVHIVEVHPDAEDPTFNKNDVEPTVPPKRDPESVEETLNNEIPKIKDNEGSKLDENIETFDQADMASPQQLSNQQWNKHMDGEDFEDNRIDSAASRPYDLSNDIYVNEVLANSGAKTNPDAEVFESLGGRTPSRQYYPEVRVPPSRMGPFIPYPNNVYEQGNPQPYGNPSFYAPPIMPMNDPYYNRFQPEQIMIVPLSNEQQPYFVPSVAHTSSSAAQTVSASTSSKTAPDKTSSAPSTT